MPPKQREPAKHQGADWFGKFSAYASVFLGSRWAFVGAILVVVIWAFSGPMFRYSDTWQLVINTGTTIVTFLMVFLIHNTQNRDNAALQAKLDELIRVTQAKNEFIGIEHLSDKELEDILEQCERHRPEALKRAEARTSAGRRAAIGRSRKRAASSTKAARG